jgi:2-polyprenyl-6-methoxyphenol hydroxylase-like FAD-dependent oxidoreductase
MPDTQVLIIGAGPTGLNLALWLTRLGVRIRIIDKVAEPGTTSRALVVHARTLEFYRQLGIADDVVNHGVEFVAVNLWVKSQHVGHVELGKLGQGLSPFPYMLVFEQDAHERLLIDHLAKAGVTVERPTELLDCQEQNNQIEARLRLADGTEQTCTAAYIAGCDGAHSTVRHAIGASFPGGTYARLFYVADVAASGPMINGELHVALDDVDLLAIFPLHAPGHARLIGTIRKELADKPDGLTWDDVSTTVIDRLGVHIDKVNWFSTYHVHHRVADHFHKGRMFILGDAAHIHSPVGGQGMNTGIGDAVNLAWKLADVLAGRATPKLLDSYEPERIAFARRLVSTTDRAFTLVTSPGRLARFIRLNVVPRVIPPIFDFTATRRLMFRTVSQIAINYRHSPISQGETGPIKAGDRLPWVAPPSQTSTAEDNFTPLAAINWQVHIYGECEDSIKAYCQQKNIPLHTFDWPPAATTGLGESALYLIRPDGYIAFADPNPTVAALDAYLSTHIKP